MKKWISLFQTTFVSALRRLTTVWQKGTGHGLVDCSRQGVCRLHG
ncbi:hypothetical protein [Geobacillus sp. 47C-IIb]|nr:hypothetical protein [Geobacillus sp. 47C-IIb]